MAFDCHFIYFFILWKETFNISFFVISLIFAALVQEMGKWEETALKAERTLHLHGKVISELEVNFCCHCNLSLKVH